MITRKDLKTNAKHVLKKHYWLLIVACLLSMFFGLEFRYTDGMRMGYLTEESSTVSGGVASLGGSSSGASFQQVVSDILSGDSQAGDEKAQEIIKKEQETNTNPVLGRTRGVLSMVVNSIFSGSFLAKISLGIARISGSQNIGTAVLIILGVLFFLFIGLFIQNVYIVVLRRIFLESRTYDKVGSQKFLFLIRVKRWCRTAWNMLVLFIFQMLWSLTVVGGVIKRYSYYLVPYILAENPDMKGCEAITLSRKMMNGHKWECCKLELSFVLWYLLGYLTLGLSDALFFNAYKTATMAEYYVALREVAKTEGLAGAENLNDLYLYEKPDRDTVQKAYADVISVMGSPLPEVKMKGLQGFLSKWFGVVLFNSQEETDYEQMLAEKTKMQKWTEVLAGERYPGRLFPIQGSEKRENLETVRYARNYSITSLIMLFFSFSLLGWLWEVSLHLVSDGVFVNRGVLHGPWLPIYGTGGILILIILKRFRNKPILEFVSAVVLCGCVEYYTSWYLQMAHNGQKWWDYSGYFLNLNGRICAEGLMIFGLGGMAIVYMAAPLLDNLFRRMSKAVLIPLCLALLIVFSCDQVYSGKHPNTGKGITDYARAIDAYSSSKAPV